MTRERDRASSGPARLPPSPATRSASTSSAAESAPGFDHLDFARFADVMLICPASANTIAAMTVRLRRRSADRPRSLAFDGPLVLAPAMNTRCGSTLPPRRTWRTLAARGVHVDPARPSDCSPTAMSVLDACPNSTSSVAELERVIAADRPLQGVSVLVTAGGTREPIDAVRYVGNRSSGKMAWALAEEASRRGAEVTVIAANVDLPRRPEIIYVDAPTAHEMHRRLLARITATRISSSWPPRSPTIGPSTRVEGKIDKSPIRAPRDPPRTDHRHPERTWLRAVAHGQVLVGFAAEAGSGRPRARPRQARAQGRRSDRLQRHRRGPASASAATRTASRSSAPMTMRRSCRAPQSASAPSTSSTRPWQRATPGAGGSARERVRSL